MSFLGEPSTSQSSTSGIPIFPLTQDSLKILLSDEDNAKSCYSPKLFLQADSKSKFPCRSTIKATQILPSTPGLDVWVSGISHRKTLEMLGYPPSNSRVSSPASKPFFPNTNCQTSRIQTSNAVNRPQIPASSVINYLLETSPKKMHININGCKRTSQVEDKSEDYAILRCISDSSEPRYWVFDIEDIHCAVCWKQMRDQRRRDCDKSRRWGERVKGAWRHQHCVNSCCHGECTHERRPHNVLTRLGISTTRKIKYIQLTTSYTCIDPDILASALTVLKPFISKLSGLEILLLSSNSVSRSSDIWNESRQEARRFICCFAELEEWLVEGARLKIRALEEFGELENMWWDVRRKWWRIRGRIGDDE